jgi:hypothetical protein
MTGNQVLGIVISVSGTLMAADQVRGLDHALRSRGWRAVQGRILDTATLRVRSPIAILSSPAVVYEYTVDGETYQAQTVNYRGSMTLGATVRVLGKYRPGRRVTVYYDPAHPHLAVLEPGASLGGLVRVLISGAVIWAGLRVFYGNGA